MRTGIRAFFVMIASLIGFNAFADQLQTDLISHAESRSSGEREKGGGNIGGL